MGVVVLAALAVCGCNQTESRVIEKVSDAEHARIGVMTGSTSEPIAAKRFPEAQVKSFDNIADAFGALKSGQLDAVITAYSSAFLMSKQNDDLKILDEPLSHEDTAIAVRKDDVALLKSLDAIISDLKADGTIASMDKRWLKSDLGPYDELVIKVPTQGIPLRVGVSATREPFSFVDGKGRVTGHDGELARLIAARLNRPIEFSDMRFMALIPALQSGKIDLIVTGMSATDERRKHVSFTQPYYANFQILLVRKAPVSAVAAAAAGGLKMASTDDIVDKRIGVMTGSAHDSYAHKHYPKAKILQFANFADITLAVQTGKVDVALSDAEPLKDILAKDNQLAVLGKPLFATPVGVGFNKDSQALHADFNQFLAQVKKDGTFDDMWDRWVVKRETKMPDIPLAGNGGMLTVGTSGAGLPFGAVKDNEMIGLDIEMLRRFAAAKGMQLRVSNMEFGALVASVAAGKVDMIADSIFITAERQKKIDFSDPYFNTDTVAFARKGSIAGYPDEAASTSVPVGFWQDVKESFQSNIMVEKRYLLLWDGLKTTIVLSILATIFGTLLGGLVCFLRMAKSPFLNVPAKIYISILRGMPVVVLLMLIYYVAFASIDINPVFVAVIAFGLNFAAYVAEIFRTGVEGVERGQTEGGLAMGFSKVQTFRLIVLPQTIRRILPVYQGEFISLVKMTSIVGYIAVQDLTKASDIIRSRTFDAFFPLVLIAVLYFLISYVLILFLDWVERRTDPKRKRRMGAMA
jgi:polar amino acid transport system substrate-binding protein